MLSGAARSSSATWQGHALSAARPTPLKEPSGEVLAKPPCKLPSSSFEADYSGRGVGGFKMTIEQGRTKVVASFPQGFTGTGVEKYPSGERYIGEYVDGRRHGRGKLSDDEGDLLSMFREGHADLEGTKIMADKAAQAAVRTYNGNADGACNLDEAHAIAKNLGLRVPGQASAAARSPPTASKLRSRVGAVAASSALASGDASHKNFLARLKQAEARDAEKARGSPAAP